MKRQIIKTLALGALLTTSALAELKSGTYKGETDSDSKVYLMLKSLSNEGRSGSFLGLMMTRKPLKLSLYVVDKINANSYSFTPFQVTNDGEIGVVNADPSLVLIEGKEGKKGKPNLKVTSSNSGNTIGFNTNMKFDSRTDKYTWTALKSGDYTSDNGEISISGFDEIEGYADSVISLGSMSGTHKILERLPYMYSINQNVVSSSGTTTNDIPNRVGVFVTKKGGFFSSTKEELIFINAKTSNAAEHLIRQ